MANGLPELNTNYGPDLAKVMLTAQAIEEGRIKNALLRRAIEKEANRGNALGQYAQSGDINPVVEADPEFGVKFMGELSKLKADQRKDALERLKAGMDVFNQAEPYLRQDPVKYYPGFLQHLNDVGINTKVFPQSFSSPEEATAYLDKLKMNKLSIEKQMELNTPKIENIQVGDQNVPTAIYPGGRMQPVGSGGPKFAPKRELRETMGSDGKPQLSWIEEPGRGAGGVTPAGATPYKPEARGQTFEMEDKLRKEFSSESSYFKQVRNAYTTVESAVAKPSAASDVALIYAIMKMFDPPSVVRESEFAVAQKAGGILDRMEGYLKKTMNGEQLSTDVRKDFAEVARRLYGDHMTQQADMEARYREMAGRYGADPQNVVADYSAMKARTGSQPTGSVYNRADLEAELKRRGLK